MKIHTRPSFVGSVILLSTLARSVTSTAVDPMHENELSWTDSLLASATHAVKARANPMLRTHRRLHREEALRDYIPPVTSAHHRNLEDEERQDRTKNSKNDEDEIGEKDKDDSATALLDSSTMETRIISISLSLTAFEQNTTTLRLQRLHPTMMDCAMARLLCQQTDLNLMSRGVLRPKNAKSDINKYDLCQPLRAESDLPPQTSFGARTESVTLVPAKEFVRRAVMQERNGVSYLEVTLSYAALFQRLDSDSDSASGAFTAIERDVAELKALTQYATDETIESGRMNQLLEFCYHAELRDEDALVELDLYSSVIGKEFETFAAFADEDDDADIPSWQRWFVDLNTPLAIGVCVMAAAVVMLAVGLTLIVRRQRKASKTDLPRISSTASLHSLDKPLPLTRSVTDATSKHAEQSDDSSDGGESTAARVSVVFQGDEEDDTYSEARAARLMEMLEKGSEASTMGPNYDDIDFSLCDERDYDHAQVTTASYISALGPMYSDIDTDADDYDMASSVDIAENRSRSSSVDGLPHNGERTAHSSHSAVLGVSLLLNLPDSFDDRGESSDDTVTEASQGNESEGDAGLVVHAHEEDESSVATCPVQNSSSRSLDSKETRSQVDSSDISTNNAFVKSRSLDDKQMTRSKADIDRLLGVTQLSHHAKYGRSVRPRSIFRASDDNMNGLLVKDLDSGKILPLVTAASF